MTCPYADQAAMVERAEQDRPFRLTLLDPRGGCACHPAPLAFWRKHHAPVWRDRPTCFACGHWGSYMGDGWTFFCRACETRWMDVRPPSQKVEWPRVAAFETVLSTLTTLPDLGPDLWGSFQARELYRALRGLSPTTPTAAPTPLLHVQTALPGGRRKP